MRIEITDQTGVKVGSTFFPYGETFTVADALGIHFCSSGWAKDLEGLIPTGKRNTSDITVYPKNAQHTHAGETVNG